MNVDLSERPAVAFRILFYFFIWLFSIVGLGVMANKLCVSTPIGDVCVYGNLGYCQWGIAAPVIGFVAYLALDILMVLYVIASIPGSFVRWIEFVFNIFFLLWYVAYAIVMSIGVHDTGTTSNSYLNTPPAMSWICTFFIIAAVVLLLFDREKAPSEETSEASVLRVLKFYFREF